MQRYDYMLCSCLFSSSNKKKILRVTFKKGLFGYQDVQTHNVQILQLMVDNRKGVMEK